MTEAEQTFKGRPGCRGCGGRGWQPCPKRETSLTCSDCNGNLVIELPDGTTVRCRGCQGSGSQPCYVCGGSGKATCSSCGGYTGP